MCIETPRRLSARLSGPPCPVGLVFVGDWWREVGLNHRGLAYETWLRPLLPLKVAVFPACHSRCLRIPGSVNAPADFSAESGPDPRVRNARLESFYLSVWPVPLVNLLVAVLGE